MAKNSFGVALSCGGTIFKTIRRNLSGKKLESEVGALGGLLGPGAVCLDIGGGYGRYAYVLSKLVGSGGRVYSFEPGTYSLGVLRAVTRFHGLKNVRVVDRALSDEPGEKTFTVPMKEGKKIAPSLAHLGVRSESSADAFSQTVTAVTIDDFAAAEGLQRLDFIKCDVEGAEWAVFRGGLRSLEKWKPPVLCEIYRGHLGKFGAAPTDLEKLFGDLGYRTFVYEDGCMKPVDRIQKDHNYFFIHASSERFPGHAR